MTGAGGQRSDWAVTVLAAAVWVASPGATSSDVLSLRADLSMQAALTCPPTLPATVACYSRTGAGVVGRFRAVSQAHINVVDTAPPGCPAGSFSLLSTTMRLWVAGKGTLTLELAESPTDPDLLGWNAVNLGRGERGGLGPAEFRDARTPGLRSPIRSCWPHRPGRFWLLRVRVAAATVAP